MRLVRKNELQRFDDVRRGAQEYFPLGQGLGDQTEFEMFQITQPAMNELGAP